MNGGKWFLFFDEAALQLQTQQRRRYGLPGYLRVTDVYGVRINNVASLTRVKMVASESRTKT